MLAAVALLVTACGKDPQDVGDDPQDDPFKVTLTPTALDLGFERGQMQFVTVDTYDDDWSYQTDAEWCKLSKTLQDGRYRLGVVAETNNGQERTATVVVSYATSSATLTVRQGAFEARISADSTEFNIMGDGAVVTVGVTCNSDYKMRIPSSVTWIKQIETELKSQARFSVAANDGTDVRSAKIALVTLDESDSVVLTVSQLGLTPNLLLSTAELAVGSDAQTVKIGVTANCKYTWTCQSQWVGFEAVDGGVNVSVADNDAKTERTAEVVFKTEVGGVSRTLKIAQEGFNPALSFSTGQTVTKDFDYHILEIDVTHNVAYRIDIPTQSTWIKAAEATTADKLVLELQPNTGETRSVEIKAVSLRGSYSQTLIVTQTKEPQRTSADVLIPISTVSLSGVTTSTGCSTSAVYDGKVATSWLGLAGSAAAITFKFEDAPHIDYFTYYPSKPYGQAGEVVVSVAYSGKTASVGTYDFKKSDLATRIDLGTSGYDGVESITLTVTSSNTPTGTAGLVAGIAEAEFFSAKRFTTLGEVFTDNSCTKLQSWITTENVQNIADTTMRKVARKLLDPAYSMDFRLCEFSMKPSPTVDANLYRDKAYSCCDTPTGMFYAKSGTYTVCLDNPTTYSVKLYVVDYNYSKTADSFMAKQYVLKNGINTVKITQPGHVYMYNHTTSVTDNSKIRVHFPEGDVNGYFDLAKNTDNQWDSLLYISRLLGHDTGVTTHYDVISDRCILAMPTTKLYQITQTGARARQLLNIYDTIVELEERLQGHEKYNTGGHHNHMWLSAIYYSYMYSTAYRTGYNMGIADVANTILNPTALKKGLWGPAHEIGHHNQLCNRFKWGGMTEVSNNVCSAYIQWCLNGKSTSLLKQNDYNTAMRDVMCRQNGNHFSAVGSNTPFQKLIPFWQLFLYYNEVKGEEFYQDLYNKLRNLDKVSSTVAATEGEMQVGFCEAASEVAGENLFDFFEAWGLLKPMPTASYIDDYGRKQMTITPERIEQARTKMSAYPKPKCDLRFITEKNYDLYINPKPVQAGTVTRTDGQVYSFEGWENVVGYLVYDADGVLRGASSSPSLVTQTYTVEWKNAAQTEVGENSTTYYKSANWKATPLTVEKPVCYGVAADGTLVKSTNTIE